MRILLDSNPSAMQVGRALAANPSVGSDRAASNVAPRNQCIAASVAQSYEVGDIPVFYSRPDTPPATLEDVERCLGDEA